MDFSEPVRAEAEESVAQAEQMHELDLIRDVEGANTDRIRAEIAREIRMRCLVGLKNPSSIDPAYLKTALIMLRLGGYDVYAEASS